MLKELDTAWHLLLVLRSLLACEIFNGPCKGNSLSACPAQQESYGARSVAAGSLLAMPPSCPRHNLRLLWNVQPLMWASNPQPSSLRPSFTQALSPLCGRQYHLDWVNSTACDLIHSSYSNRGYWWGSSGSGQQRFFSSTALRSHSSSCSHFLHRAEACKTQS